MISTENRHVSSDLSGRSSMVSGLEKCLASWQRIAAHWYCNIGGVVTKPMADFPLTRASLLVRLRNPKDEATWRQFVDLYTPLVYGYARKAGLQDADAADLSQDVLSAVAGAVGRLEYDPRRGTFRNWLFTVVRRKLSNWRVARGNRLRGTGDPATQNLLDNCVAPEGAEVEWEAEWERRLVAWACEQVRHDVAEITWQAFWRTAIDGQPIKQVAADLGVNLGVVYHARSRIVARLKELVQSVQEP
jgi:RNA polymerase sigma factor (sigma-70 family)